ncbi:hypothetical protein COUCH_26730 [Couchioplanes caeruleus]|uniref:hypothetical protein n=1 Tax=Couchioplanes caeruleus TaxID=56438 RepID=UPI0020BD514B|nr:hypothetical protein [Couchioplanes caeruleus]UQU62611.1 hypothetical protein COUCH_26730 [Couchioplanes caeruleus]
MSAVIHAAALWCVAAGLLAGAVVTVSARDGRAGLRVALDFWLAAGLLNLSFARDWGPPLVAALVLAVRQTAGLGLRHSAAGLRDLFPRRSRNDS